MFIHTINLCNQNRHLLQKPLSVTGYNSIYLIFELFRGYSYSTVEAFFTVQTCPTLPFFAKRGVQAMSKAVSLGASCFDFYYLQQLPSKKLEGLVIYNGMSVIVEIENVKPVFVQDFWLEYNSFWYEISRKKYLMTPYVTYSNVQDVGYNLSICFAYLKPIIIRFRNITLESGHRVVEGKRFLKWNLSK